MEQNKIIRKNFSFGKLYAYPRHTFVSENNSDMEHNDEKLIEQCFFQLGFTEIPLPLSWGVVTSVIVEKHDIEILRQYADHVDWDYISRSDWICAPRFLDEFEEKLNWRLVVNNDDIGKACATVFWSRFEDKIPADTYDDVANMKLFDKLVGE